MIVMNQEEILFRITGKNGSQDLSPDNFDIAQIKVLFDSVESLLFPDVKSKKNRPIISYQMRAGSVVNVFRTSLQSVLTMSAIISAIGRDNGSIDRLETNSAIAIESLQSFAVRNNYTIEISTSDTPKNQLIVSPYTNFIRHQNVMVDVEYYYYGTLVDAGGKDRANIHLDTKEAGLLTIKAEKDYLSGIEGNPLYRKFGARVKAKQNIMTLDIDKSTLELVELIDYNPRFDSAYLDELIAKASPRWQAVDGAAWIRELRGGIYE